MHDVDELLFFAIELVFVVDAGDVVLLESALFEDCWMFVMLRSNS